MPVETPLVLVGVTGSIAAFKACDVARDLQDRGAAVQVLMTESAARFVTPLTFHTLTGRPPVLDMFETGDPTQLPHLTLARDASLVVVAPATANVIGRIAHGLADDMVTATIMACRAPLLLAPAMNSMMWRNPAVEANVRLLRDRGVHFVGPVSGKLAASFEGEAEGRMAEPGEIVAEACRLLGLD